jgi:membrane protein implicated in regulation of membrane protease activity
MTKFQRIFAILAALVACFIAVVVVVGLSYGALAVGVMLMGTTLAVVVFAVVGFASAMLSGQL